MKLRIGKLNLQRGLSGLLSLMLLALWGIGNSHRAMAQVVVDSKLDNAEILVGEQAHLTTIVTIGNRQKVEFPNYDSTDTLVAGVEVLSCSSIDTTRLNAGQRLRLERTYTITSFDSALYALPPMTVIVDGKLYASRSKLGLKVGSIPVDTLNVNQFEPPFTVAESPFAWRSHLLCLSLVPCACLMFLLLAAIRLTGHKPMRRKVTIKPPIPPYKKAQSHIEKLRPDVERAAEAADNKAFFIRLTDIVRTYITERYSFNAMEKTTSEIVEGLRQQVDAPLLQRLADIFRTADFIKFAKRTATSMERKRCLEQAAEVLAATRDEEMERPRPIVRYVTYSDTRQHRIRLCLWVVAAVASICAIGGAIYTANTIWTIFF